jgi:subtilase family serine protease
MDDLEPRALLSTTPLVAQPTFVAVPLQSGGQPSAPYTPAQLKQAYGFNSILFNGVVGTGSGETIAIVDAYNDPNIQSDLNTFDSEFNLPATTVTRVNETGGTSYPASDPTGGWELEESLDVEWAHAMAPGANILLVEASSTSLSDLLTAVQYGASHANVVSMSWGGGEFSGETAYDSYFDHAGVAFVAASGDSGAPAEWPAASPNVLSVGGTALTLGAGNVWSSEVGWSGSGGGPSAYESQPSYQKGVVTQTSTARATPDVAYDASPSTGVYVYDSVPYGGESGWWEVGGTSAGAPQWSALLAIADQGRAQSGQLALNSSSPQQVMSILYDNPADFHDITSSTSTGTPNYSAGPGYDYVTGMGSPIANLIVGSLVGTSTASYGKLVLAAPTNLVASARAVSSTQINLTWTGSNGATGYLIQQSLNGSTGWTQVGSSTSTTFQQTGLSTGTTYYFRVVATLGTIDSAYSNVASATTSGTAATPDSIWGNSSVPSENYYSYGSYELGVKFTASVAGEVTGVRFYKQTWMGGYVHVGHLWSSTGTLLATATFTNESAYGWQQVTFSSPVAIQAKTVYIASFSTGGGYFGITSSFFTSSGVINGPLEAQPNSVSGGDGVYYNRAGTFPGVDGNGMNFWADVAFTPSSSGNITAKASSPASHSIAVGGFDSSASTSDQSSHFFISAPATTPAWPARHAALSRGTTPAVVGSLLYHRPIPQAATLASWLKKSFLASGSI